MDLGALPPHLEVRCRWLRRPTEAPRFIVYWLRTACRAHENPALDVALTLGASLGVPVVVHHALAERYPYASDRHHTFILEGARELRDAMRERGVGYAFHLERPGHRGPVLKALAEQAGLVVTEEMPVPPLSGWTRALSQVAPVLAVDTACVVPMPLTGRAPERAFRFKNETKKLRKRFLGAAFDDVPASGPPFVPDALPFTPLTDADFEDIPGLVATCDIDHGVGPVFRTPGGSTAGYARWNAFVASGGLRGYGRRRNDPLRDGVSRMSAYLHYGMVSPLRLAREAFAEGSDGAEKYLDELLVWRELAYHWCFHTPDPESYEEAIPAWAQETLAEALGDARAVLDLETLERGRTGDALWDACQASLLRHGELHNNVRMTWGKAVPLWTRTPRDAMARLIDLNHRFALDGRDPCSYGGLLWCLGLFDSPKGPSPVLGQVRGRRTDVHARRLDVAVYARRVARPAHPTPPRTLVVGAGFAGLSCARALADHGFEVTVVDKGRRQPGGRCSARRGEGWSFDHGAQLLRTDDVQLARYARSWRERGLLARWDARFVTLGPDGPTRREGMEADVGVPDMNALARHLADDVSVRQGLRVTTLRRSAAGWSVTLADGEDLGRFDRLVLALPAAQAAPLLAEAGHGFAEHLGSVEVEASLTAMVAFAGSLSLPFDAASAGGDAALAWMARESSKPGRPSFAESGLEAWTLQASAAYGAQRLDLDRDGIAEDLLARFAEVAMPLHGPLPDAPIRMGHRWRYAQTTRALGESCLFDPDVGLGVCGDWCLGDRLEHAFRSGRAMAGRILAS